MKKRIACVLSSILLTGTMIPGAYCQTNTPVTNEARTRIVEQAKSYVGEISYDQSCHGNRLEQGASNDSSGFVSQILYGMLGHNYTASSFYYSFDTTKWDDNKVKPGDIILHFDDGMPDGQGDHVLLYAGKDPVTGQNTSIDLNTSGVTLRSRPESYYNEAYIISLDEIASNAEGTIE